MSDRYGRKKPILIGIVLFVIGSIGCALSTSIAEMVLWRIIQALGACSGPVLSRVMVRDRYNHRQAAQKISTLIMLMAAAPLIGPFLGGQVLKYDSWHDIFWMLVSVGIVILLLLPRDLPESLPKMRR